MLGAVQAEHIKVELLVQRVLAEVVWLARLEGITLVETELQIRAAAVEPHPITLGQQQQAVLAVLVL